MKIVRFSPGDGTSYFVQFHRLTTAERREIGGLYPGAVWYGFGPASIYNFPSHPFQGNGYLDFNYYFEKMGQATDDKSMYTHHVGHRVLCYLTGCNMGQPRMSSWTKAQFEGWDGDWREQLNPLLEDN